CALCLSPHLDVRSCHETTIWSGAPARSRRNSDGRLVNKNGLILCIDFQRQGRCAGTGDYHLHECSGCGATSHGAKDCHLAKKN
ncbi:hypothetical protein BDW22DRAFT_1327631, partial [Trametopsis cervina]